MDWHFLEIWKKSLEHFHKFQFTQTPLAIVGSNEVVFVYTIYRESYLEEEKKQYSHTNIVIYPTRMH